MSFKEANYENAIIELLTDRLGYEHVYGPDVARDYRSPLMTERLMAALERVNPALPGEAITEALHKLTNFEGGTPVQKNAHFIDWLQNGIEVNFHHGGEQKSALVRLVDYDRPERNDFCVANQWTVEEHSVKRPDIVIFMNGLPLVVVELKSPSREQTDVSEAYAQLRNYMREIPSLFYYNAMCVISDQLTTKVGTITADEGRYMEWKTVNGDSENKRHAAFNVLFEGMFEKARFLDILRNFICFSKDDASDRKILAAYHQYYAVRKAVTSTSEAAKTDGKGGVFWHTQGSGKSLSMVFYARLLQSALDSPTIVVLTDRNDLDDQLYRQFSSCKNFLRQTPVQAYSREHLRQLLAGRQANGIFFTTMQKFEEVDKALSERRNIVVMADEAHRGQYGFTEKVDPKTGKVSIGAARVIRDNLPNATYIGFTGTPISTKDRSTREVFGDYIDIYDMTQSVEDGATRPVYYESRVINLKLDKEILEQIDKKYDELAEMADAPLIEKSKQELGRLDSILGSPETIDSLCRDIVAHYEDRQYLLTGKAMVVAYSRPIAMKIYEKLLELRPAWREKVKVVMTSDNRDPEEWHDIVGNKTYREDLARKFKDNDDPMKIAIVVDMWLTGFDVPSLATMYVYKPMSGHNLMQAIARVNRVFQDKEGGLVVDYVGIASALKQAMSDYTRRDQSNYGEMDIIKTALPKFIEKLDVCRDLMHGYDYSAFMTSKTDYPRAQTISGGVDFFSSPEMSAKKANFIKEALLLRQAMSLCHSRLDESQRFEAAYFEAVRILLTRVGGQGKLSFKEINQAINELLKQSIHSEGVINLFSDIREEFSLFDPKFLAEISQMKERNLAVEMLKKLIAEQISIYKRTNVVKSEKFSEMMARSMSNYLKGLLTNEQVIEELLKMAHDITQASREGEEMGLNTEEMAFYDALTKPDAVKDFYDNDQLVAITKELTDTLRKNKTIDWQKKERARAGMRMIVKRLLRKYKYPPEGVEDAINTVIAQCEMWSDDN
ncbi:MAG: type I restriction endonuclease subunit R [Rikenellaceae bacterium]|jgi:type I restriction enzyme R subunit|nr:type I restriction endonuclease subunit R [Rikenellaceae bacterium]